jgi:hypothetical protein
LIVTLAILVILCKENVKRTENLEATKVSDEGYQGLNVNSHGYQTPKGKNRVAETFHVVQTTVEGIIQPKERKLHGLTLDEPSGINTWPAYY